MHMMCSYMADNLKSRIGLVPHLCKLLFKKFILGVILMSRLIFQTKKQKFLNFNFFFGRGVNKVRLCTNVTLKNIKETFSLKKKYLFISKRKRITFFILFSFKIELY